MERTSTVDLTKPAPEGPLLVNRRQMAHSLDGGLAARARIGLVVLSSDHTVEYEFHRIAQRLPGVAVYGARIRNSPKITPESLAAMEGLIAQTADLILPGMPLDAVGYGCTSASMVIGEERVSEQRTAGFTSEKVRAPVPVPPCASTVSPG